MSLSDPQWGKRGNAGPPDLHELWAKVRRRLAALFGRGGGTAPPERGGQPALPLGGLGLICLLVVLVWLASGFYMLDAAWRGIVLRFGAYQETTLPGARWHLPYPIESVEKVNVSDLRQVVTERNPGHHRASRDRPHDAVQRLAEEDQDRVENRDKAAVG